jgi:hypothetical protein
MYFESVLPGWTVILVLVYWPRYESVDVVITNTRPFVTRRVAYFGARTVASNRCRMLYQSYYVLWYSSFSDRKEQVFYRERFISTTERLRYRVDFYPNFACPGTGRLHFRINVSEPNLVMPTNIWTSNNIEYCTPRIFDFSNI